MAKREADAAALYTVWMGGKLRFACATREEAVDNVATGLARVATQDVVVKVRDPHGVTILKDRGKMAPRDYYTVWTRRYGRDKLMGAYADRESAELYARHFWYQGDTSDRHNVMVVRSAKGSLLLKYGGPHHVEWWS